MSSIFQSSIFQSSISPSSVSLNTPEAGDPPLKATRQLRVGYLTHYADNTLDPLAWSGTLFAMQRQLGLEGFEVIHLGKAKQLSARRRKWQKYINKAISQAIALLHLPHPSVRSQRRRFIRNVQRKLAQQPCDLIFAVVAAREIALLEIDIPIVYLSDATAKVYYPLYKKGNNTIFAQSVETEYQAYYRAQQIIFSSNWAAASAMRDYGIDPAKVNVIPFGANLDQLPERQLVFQRRQSPIAKTACKLIFCAVEWERKGGAIAVETLHLLRDMGVDAELIVIGCKPPEAVRHEKIRVVGFLDKGSAQDCQTYEQLLWEAHLFLLPTRADCFGIAFCEASAFGLPSLTTQIGGVGEAVINDRNGYALPLAAGGQDYADRIRHLIENPAIYNALVQSSRDEYEQRLNWGYWGQCFRQVAAAALNADRPYATGVNSTAPSSFEHKPSCDSR
jgi:glycosyltransferase involved in cell wall biosynthesis